MNVKMRSKAHASMINSYGVVVSFGIERAHNLKDVECTLRYEQTEQGLGLILGLNINHPSKNAVVIPYTKVTSEKVKKTQRLKCQQRYLRFSRFP